MKSTTPERLSVIARCNPSRREELAWAASIRCQEIRWRLAFVLCEKPEFRGTYHEFSFYDAPDYQTFY